MKVGGRRQPVKDKQPTYPANPKFVTTASHPIYKAPQPRHRAAYPLGRCSDKDIDSLPEYKGVRRVNSWEGGPSITMTNAHKKAFKSLTLKASTRNYAYVISNVIGTLSAFEMIQCAFAPSAISLNLAPSTPSIGVAFNSR